MKRPHWRVLPNTGAKGEATKGTGILARNSVTVWGIAVDRFQSPKPYHCSFFWRKNSVNPIKESNDVVVAGGKL